jgi:serine/threonine protein phosphatase PrpC
MLLGQTEKGETEGEAGDRTIPAAITDTGCERDLNEDRYAVVESPSGLAWLVCDGMGGATGGELAAQLAIDAIRRDLENLPARPSEEALRNALLEANRVIVLRRQNQAFAQMGTTIVGAMFDGPEVVIAHVGDSRAYLIRDGAIQQLTIDHTYVQELVEKGHIKPEDALAHPQAHILTRAIGSEPALEISLQQYWVCETSAEERPDLLVLCTDGLYSQVNEAEVATIVTDDSPQGACVKLVELAKARGGYDNISVAIIPLGGQLRQEPPAGYDPRKALERKRPRANQAHSGRSLWRTLAVVAVLSVLAALLTVVGVMTFGVGQ